MRASRIAQNGRGAPVEEGGSPLGPGLWARDRPSELASSEGLKSETGAPVRKDSGLAQNVILCPTLIGPATNKRPERFGHSPASRSGAGSKNMEFDKEAKVSGPDVKASPSYPSIAKINRCAPVEQG